MSDESNQPDPDEHDDASTTATAAGNEQVDAKFSQADVDALLAKRLARAERQHQKALDEVNAKLAKAAPKEKTKTAPAADDRINEVMNELATMKADAAFQKALKTTGKQFSEEDEQILRVIHEKDPDKLPIAAARFAAGKREGDAVPNDESKYQSPGGVNSPAEVNIADATQWSGEYVARLRADGTFREELEKYRNSLPGGSNGLFRKRPPKK